MATRIEPFEVIATAGTTKTAFQRTSLPLQRGRVERIQIRIPPGPSGLVGFRFAHSNQSVLPYTGERWFVSDDDKLDWELSGFPDGNKWELWTYNTDNYPHTIFVWIHVVDFGPAATVTVPIVEIAQIAPSELEPTLEEVT